MVSETRGKLFRKLFEEKGAAQAKGPAERKGTAIPHNRRRSRAEKELLLKKQEVARLLHGDRSWRGNWDRFVCVAELSFHNFVNQINQIFNEKGLMRNG